ANDPKNIYKLMIGSIVPRPIAFVSTQNSEGALNLAPFSFFTGVSANPPAVLFCPLVRPSDAKTKDTLNNIRATKEFVVNVVSETFAEQMNLTSAEFPPEVSEFAESGLTPVPSQKVRPPRVKESPINMECRLLQMVPVGSGLLGGTVVIGEIVLFHVADELFDNFRIDLKKLAPIGRLAGSSYCRVIDIFDLARPKTGEVKP
ncbi:MAG TPA: flavin reductase family protein, partial [Saprospiraceae bacterium]|nr:flavin reductase family protein [Saprospiraceae bacterium]